MAKTDVKETKLIYHCLFWLPLQISKDQILSFERFLFSFEYLGYKFVSVLRACFHFLFGINLNLSDQGVLGEV